MVRIADIAASLSAVLSHFDPLRVRPDLGEDVLRGAGLDPIDGAQQLNRRLERAQLLLDRIRQPLDLLVQEVQVSEDR